MSVAVEPAGLTQIAQAVATPLVSGIVTATATGWPFRAFPMATLRLSRMATSTLVFSEKTGSVAQRACTSTVRLPKVAHAWVWVPLSSQPDIPSSSQSNW
jgi:hypothetical protein